MPDRLEQRRRIVDEGIYSAELLEETNAHTDGDATPELFGKEVEPLGNLELYAVDTGVVALRSTPPENTGKTTFDGVSLVSVGTRVK